MNFRIKLYNDSAWSVHDELVTMANGNKGKNIITQFLDKQDGEWKAVHMSMISATSYNVAE